jgi:D-lactate dehydrogenase (cytochrome)
MIIKDNPEFIFQYTFDASNLKGNAQKVYIPENQIELHKIIIDCYNNNEKITIAGAGTGITGARVPFGGSVISTEQLNKILEIGSNYVIVEPYVTLSQLSEELDKYNLFLPPNPTEINATIGGNVATNASGARTFKYGAIRDWVLELEIILSNGEILNLKRGEIIANNCKLILKTNNSTYEIPIKDIGMPNIKNASGYYIKDNMDAIDLFIGSEGTLGIISKIKLKVINKPDNIIGGIIFFDDEKKLIEFVEELRDISLINNKVDYKENNEISARLIEYFDKNSLELIRNKFPQIPFQSIGAIWFEQEYCDKYEDEIVEKWNNFIIKNTTLYEDTWIATNEKEHNRLREFRHELPLQVYENLSANSQTKVGLDTAVPTKYFRLLYENYHKIFSKLDLQNVIFGHIGNSHLHANIFCKNEDEYKLAINIYDEIIKITLDNGGTVSAEHGIGKLKKKYLKLMYGEQTVNYMKQIKQILDKKNLLNVGNIFD